MQEHEVDSDGYRIIKPEHCAEVATIEDAIIAVGSASYNKAILRSKLELALRLRRAYEHSIKIKGWWS